MRHPSLISISVAAAVVVIATSPAAGAQTPLTPARAERIAGSLSLAEAAQRALRDAPDVRLSAQAADAALGAATSAHSVYDATIQTSVVHSRQNGLRIDVPGVTGGDPTLQSSLTSSVTSSVAAQQRLPWAGVIVAPQLNVTSAGSPGALAQSRASAQLGLTVPLARNRGGALSSAAMGAAYADADAAVHDLLQASSAGVYQAVIAYWAYVGTQRRLDVYVAAEDRAKRNLAQTTALVAGDERPAADLVLLRGNVATKLSARISAEQTVLEAWRSLAAILAVGDVDIINTPAASTDFPEIPANSSTVRDLSAAETQALVDAALSRRADVAAASTRVHVSELSLRTTSQLMRPIIDVVAQVGYNGLEQGSGLQNFVSPLYRNRSPLNATVQLVYQFSPANSDAAGRSRQATAFLEQGQEARRLVERSVTTGVVVAIAGLRRSILSAEAAHRSTEAARQTVENELHKFRLGSSTVFDVIYAEDNLTNALLGDVAGRQTFAGAIARAQFELGTLVTGERDTRVANVAGLMHAPSIVGNP